MRVIVSGTASSRLSRVQRTLSNVTEFEASVLADQAIDAALNDTVSNKEGTSARNGFSSGVKDSKGANECGSLGHQDPSALVLLSPQDLCACGLFNCDVVQVASCAYHRCIDSFKACQKGLRLCQRPASSVKHAKFSGTGDISITNNAQCRCQMPQDPKCPPTWLLSRPSITQKTPPGFRTALHQVPKHC